VGVGIDKITDVFVPGDDGFIYDVLGDLDAELCVDVGAAAGFTSRKMCRSGGDSVRVVAFEPFPGNVGYFRENTREDSPRIRLIEKAVSDRAGKVRFHVRKVVDGSEEGWEEMRGYSSLGKMTELSAWRFWIRKLTGALRNLFGANAPRLLTVRTTSIDDEFPDETLSFVKMDVQGGEERVLKGARKAMEEGRIKLMYIEWSGDAGVLKWLDEFGYRVFDSTYVGGVVGRDEEKLRELGFRMIGVNRRSSGVDTCHMVLDEAGRTPEAAIGEAAARFSIRVETDLIAVHPDWDSQLRTALGNLARREAPSR